MRDPAGAVVSVDRPADFDAFWAGTMALTEAVDPAPVLTPRPDLSTHDVTVSELTYASFQDVRVAAWVSAPAGPVPHGGWPAVLHIPGYISEPAVMRGWARRGYVTVDVAPRGKLRADAVVNPGYPGLLTADIVDRFTYAYRGFYADVVRAVDVVGALPDVDAARLGIWGSSQGGGLGIVAAALRPDAVACVAAGAPYLCGIMACTGLTRSYPYEEITEYLRVHPGDEPLVRETAAYFDGLNFARTVAAPVLIYLGLEDDVCPPETGFALHRELATSKKLLTYPQCGHDAGLPEVLGEIETFLDTHLKDAA